MSEPELRRWASVDPGPFRFGPDAPGEDPHAWLQDVPLADLRAVSLHHKVNAWRRGELSEHEERIMRGNLWRHRPAFVLDALEPSEREELRVDDPDGAGHWRRHPDAIGDGEAPQWRRDLVGT